MENLKMQTIFSVFAGSTENMLNQLVLDDKSHSRSEKYQYNSVLD